MICIRLIAALAVLTGTAFAYPPTEIRLSTGHSEPGLLSLAENSVCNPKFRDAPRLSHLAYDDPVIFPAEPGASHLHAFFNATSANAFTTTESLHRAKRVTGRGSLNRSSYFQPVLMQDERPLIPSETLLYYTVTLGGDGCERLREDGRFPDDWVRPVPDGLQMLAGPRASGVSPWVVDGERVGWRVRTVFPTCIAVDDAGQPIRDYRELGADAGPNDHVRYQDRRLEPPYCPAGHPYAIPEIALTALYRTTGEDVTLSSGGFDTAHADAFVAWDADTMAAMIDGLRAGRSSRFNRSSVARNYSVTGDQLWWHAGTEPPPLPELPMMPGELSHSAHMGHAHR